MAKAKAVITRAWVEDEIIMVSYESGAQKKVKLDSIPKTVQAWIEKNDPDMLKAEEQEKNLPATIMTDIILDGPEEETEAIPQETSQEAPESDREDEPEETIDEAPTKATGAVLEALEGIAATVVGKAPDILLGIGMVALDIWDILARTDILARWIIWTFWPMLAQFFTGTLRKMARAWGRMTALALDGIGTALIMGDKVGGILGEYMGMAWRELRDLWEGREELVREWA